VAGEVAWYWSNAKDRRNRAQHDGLGLENGVAVLNGDPLALSRPDPHPDGDRWQTIGRAGATILFAVHTEPIEEPDGSAWGRIISVRKATAHERRQYEEETFW
jgi:uncharacterized DUF497 family protein